MRKAFVSGVLLLLLPLALWAQTPKAEVFGGFSYVNVDHSNFPGWNASITGNVNSSLGIVGDFSGYYNHQSFTDFLGNNDRLRTSFHNFLVGPRVSDRQNKWVTPFAELLGGYTRANSSLTSSGPGFSSSSSSGANGFGLVLGGGVDLGGSHSISYRLIQVDYYLVNAASIKHEGVRVTTGFVWRLGQRND